MSAPSQRVTRDSNLAKTTDTFRVGHECGLCRGRRIGPWTRSPKIPGRQHFGERPRSGDVNQAGTQGIRPFELSGVPSRQRHRPGLHDEVILIARRLEANFGVCRAHDQPDLALAGRPVGKLEADHHLTIGKVGAREVAGAPRPEQKPRIRVLVAQLDPAFAPGAERQQDGPKLIAGIRQDIPDSGPARLGRGGDESVSLRQRSRG
jgi:hypothetical protein